MQLQAVLTLLGRGRWGVVGVEGWLRSSFGATCDALVGVGVLPEVPGRLRAFHGFVAVLREERGEISSKTCPNDLLVINRMINSLPSSPVYPVTLKP